MDARQFGHTGLIVPALGLGAGPLGDPRISEEDAEQLVHAALDHGVTLIDTAKSYGLSEERIGRALRGQRRRAVLSTKVGYGVAGVRDWTAESVSRGVDEALARLGTDYVDILHLHSCPAEVLRAGEVTRAVADAKAHGKARVVAYSGDNAGLDEAVASGVFASVELTLNPWDQGVIDRTLWKAKDRGMGVIAKRPLANAWWMYPQRPARRDIAEYWDRARALSLPWFDLPAEALSLRFAAFTWGVDCAIAGTTSVAHLEALVRAVSEGPLPEHVVRGLREGWQRKAAAWPAIV